MRKLKQKRLVRARWALSVLTALIGLAAPGVAAAVAVGGNTATGGYDPATGANYSELRSTLQSDFPGSTFATVPLTTVGLIAVDLLVLNRFNSPNLTPEEQTAVYDFVVQGGNVVYVGEAAGGFPNDTYTLPFSVTMIDDPSTVVAQATATYTNPTHPFLTGPFGAPSSPPTGATSAQVSVLGSSVELAKWDGGGVAISAIDHGVIAPGAGFVLFFTDFSMFNIGRYQSEVGPVISNALAAPEPGTLLIGPVLMTYGLLRRRRTGEVVKLPPFV